MDSVLRWLLKLTVALSIIISSTASAQAPMEKANRARGTVAMKLHLLGADLLDELVYRWTKNPPLAQKSDVMVMNIEGPLGLNSNLNAFLENHLFRLLIQHEKSNIVPVHCPLCSVTTAYSSPEGTIIGKGADIPKVSGKGVNARYALYVDLSIERSLLVLRSRLVSLDEQRRVVQAETIATDSGSPPSLRKPDSLVSVKEAREEYEQILRRQGRARLSLGTKISMFNFSDSNVTITPMPWVLLGVDVFPSEQRDWYMNFSLGTTSIPNEFNGTQISSRYATRLLPKYSNLIQPEIFGFVGFEYFQISGNAGRVFTSSGKQSGGDLIAAITDEDTEDRFDSTVLTLGVEVQLARMTRIGVFVGRMLHLRDDTLFGSDYHLYGVEMGVSL
ncbi:hypothetical protein [Pseudobacteriovorax antillogorgiicola]|uniref:Outer membrane protein beta-barrel domain-containing protein n=1 Tax=Pseudobacteriovorax antillogorgiicola TaxID=1513793 RepID=A0A1Y6CJX3_9BACT|nr:hypothetical protein [Pseudobacteriovorax antillogorgiicola]TCS45902.1 hypothetical protein EDD56_12665 [Pseudobacteriovorax antillogorgiicola]SMF71123.1 hypothetical protein SAMN06296036_12633 [Pseudobacteriovorax antillogorgiicola]